MDKRVLGGEDNDFNVQDGGYSCRCFDKPRPD